MAKLTKKQFEGVFREEILPYVIKRERPGLPDKPGRRQAWNDTVDTYIRDRMLPEAAGDWGHPRWLETYRPRGSGSHHATKKKSTAQLNREIAEVLAPRVLKISPGKTFAGQRSITANVQYPGEAPSWVEFVGPSASIGGPGPVVMILRGHQTFVTDPSRFGNFGSSWVRRFFESA